MPRYLGDYRANQTIDFTFTSLSTAGTGAPGALSSADGMVYKGNSATQSTAGIVLTATFDSIVGLNHLRISTTADGTFYADGNDFNVVLSTGAVGSVSLLGYTLASFSLNNRSALVATTTGKTLDVSAGGEAGIDWANIGSPTATNTLSGTIVSSSQVVASVTGAVGSVTGAVGSVTGAVGSVTGNVGGNVTGSVGSVVGAVGSVTGNVGGNVVGSVASVTGSVGSVTGAVGSVTGNVGGNVVGSVGSVTGAVGSVTGNVGGNVVGSVGSVTGAVGSVTIVSAGAVSSSSLTAGTYTSIADDLLDRDMSLGIDSGSTSVRTPRQAFRFLRNKWTVNSTNTLTVYKEDDAATSWTSVVTVTSSADPVTGSDPAGP